MMLCKWLKKMSVKRRVIYPWCLNRRGFVFQENSYHLVFVCLLLRECTTYMEYSEYVVLMLKLKKLLCITYVLQNSTCDCQLSPANCYVCSLSSTMLIGNILLLAAQVLCSFFCVCTFTKTMKTVWHCTYKTIFK